MEQNARLYGKNGEAICLFYACRLLPFLLIYGLAGYSVKHKNLNIVSIAVVVQYSSHYVNAFTVLVKSYLLLKMKCYAMHWSLELNWESAFSLYCMQTVFSGGRVSVVDKLLFMNQWTYEIHAHHVHPYESLVVNAKQTSYILSCFL